MDLDEARVGMHLARLAIESAVSSGERIEAPEGLSAVFEELGGVFVTLHSGGLRGCVGYPYPTMTIKEALIDVLRSGLLPPEYLQEIIKDIDALKARLDSREKEVRRLRHQLESLEEIHRKYEKQKQEASTP